jgi:hypothetical protein
MVIWAREKGMKATFAASDPSQVMARLKEGQPLILLLETGLGPLRKGHFVVAVGYGPEGLVVNSGLIQQEIMPWADFLKSWRKMGNFTIFVSPGAPAGAPEEADSLGEAEAAPGEGEDEAEAREVVSPARVAQKLNLPVGLELPEELVEAPMGPKEPVIPARQIQSAPGYLIGVDLPDAKTRPETPIIDITEYPLEKAEETTRAASEAAGPEPGAEAGGAKGPAEEAVPGKSRMVVVMEPLPPGDVQKGDPGFSQRDLGPPLVLPVVPLPEEQPITGQLMGSDAVAPATVPGARRPGKKAEEAPSGPAEDAPATPPAGTALESPVMGWER